MTNNSRVLNVSRGFTLKYKQALRAIENCAAAWVDPGQSIRDVSLAESIAMRNEQAKRSEGLVYWVEGKDGKLIAKPFVAEIPGLIYQPGINGLAASRRGFALVREAHQFAASI